MINYTSRGLVLKGHYSKITWPSNRDTFVGQCPQHSTKLLFIKSIIQTSQYSYVCFPPPQTVLAHCTFPFIWIGLCLFRGSLHLVMAFHTTVMKVMWETWGRAEGGGGVMLQPPPPVSHVNLTHLPPDSPAAGGNGHCNTKPRLAELVFLPK